MDAAMLMFTESDRRRMRMGEVTAATRFSQRRVLKPGDVDEHEGAEAHATSDEQTGEETDAQAKARVAREKLQYRDEEKRRRNFEEILQARLGETRKLAAQNGIPQLTALYKAQKEMRTVDAEKDEAATDVQTQLGASSAQIQALMTQARDNNVSWAYRKSVLSRARLAVSDHLAALHQIQDRYYDKFAEFAGKQPDMLADISAKASDVEARKRAMEEYYGILEHLASGDGSGTTQVSGAASNVAPEIVRNSSAMRLFARRRRNFWAEIA